MLPSDGLTSDHQGSLTEVRDTGPPVSDNPDVSLVPRFPPAVEAAQALVPPASPGTPALPSPRAAEIPDPSTYGTPPARTGPPSGETAPIRDESPLLEYHNALIRSRV